MDSTRATFNRSLIYSIIITGFISYLSIVAITIGFDTRLLFISGDVFADFFKFIASYPGETIDIESWTPAPIKEKISNYILNNPYTGVGSANTNLWIPPAGTFMYLVIRNGLSIGPVTMFLVTFISLSTLYFAVIKKFLDKQEEKEAKPLITALLIMVTYPFMFLFMRGNVGALAAGLCLLYSIQQLLEKRRFSLGSILSLSIAIGIRPNYIFLLPLIIAYNFAHKKGDKLQRIGGKLKDLTVALGIIITINCLFFVISKHIYPEYTISNFLGAYKLYTQSYEFGQWGINYNSTLLQGLNTVLLTFKKLSLIDIEVKTSILKLIRYILLMACSVYSLRQINAKGLEKNNVFCKKLLTLIAIIILTAPVFADYHLIIIYIPFLGANMLSKKVDTETKYTDKVLPSLAQLDVYDHIFMILIIIPKPYLPLIPVTLQTIINPIIIVVYLINNSFGIGGPWLKSKALVGSKYLGFKNIPFK